MTLEGPVAVPARRGAGSAKSGQRIREILRVAREVLAERGFAATTTSEIALRLGVSEATVFTYFRGKRELCLRVLADWYDEIIAAMALALPPALPVRAQFEAFVRTHLELFLVNGTGLCALVLSEGRSKGPDLGDSMVPLQRRYTAPLMALLARGQASGEIRCDLPLRLLRPMVLGPIEHILWELVARAPDAREPVDSTAIARDLVPMLWAAIAAPDEELARLRRLREALRSALASS